MVRKRGEARPMATALQCLLEKGLRDCANEVAIRVGDRVVTFAELDEEVRRCAAGMLAKSIEPGDRVALMLPNRLETVIAILACYTVGAVAMPLNYRYLADEAEHAIILATPKLLLFHAERADVIHEVLKRVGPIQTFRLDDGNTHGTGTPPFAELLQFEPFSGPVHLDEQAPALLLFTSGTTALPKGVVHSHASTF
ncbi:MAG: acyl--CoA ligase, partial [Gammaproteobacteria bacterium]|nr:acyl--CoA ligase [Gammaproteobacteria bacterium]